MPVTRAAVWILAAAVAARGADEDSFPPCGPLVAHDSLAIGIETSADAQACLTGLAWAPAEFTVDVTPLKGDQGDLLLRFPSPAPIGLASNDLAALEWYAARDEKGRPMRARAVVVVHESGSRMAIGRMIARGLQQRGLHAFLIHLPYYGERRQAERRPPGDKILTIMRQAIADVRRARDVVAVLPLVESDHVALQGTSLGGLLSATVAGLDRGYSDVFLLLAGGDLASVVETGRRDAAKFRMELARAGVSGDKLREVAATIEPLRLAHRVDADHTWLYSAEYDQVVPPHNAQLLADAMHLSRPHHIQLAADHYLGVIYLPCILDQIAGRVRASH